MKKSISLAVVAFIFSSVGSSYAAGESFTKDLYLTMDLAYSKADINEDMSGFEVDDTDTGFAGGLGYELNKYVAVEIGYVDFGKASANSSGGGSGTYNGKAYTYTGTIGIDAEADAFYYGTKLSFPVMDKLDLYAKLGLFSWDYDITATASGSLTYDGTAYAGNVSATGSDSGTDSYYGLGASYDVTDLIGIRTDWTRYIDIGGTVDVDLFSAGIVFKFGKLF